jgi:DNA-binding transcriptional regulator LsrR (DeoR family)
LSRQRSTRVPAGGGAPSPLRDGALILSAAYLYYAEDRSQEEIANQLGVSRSTVSRLLAEARQSGVVRIEVTAPPPVDGLEKELARQLGLERVYVAQGVAAPDDPGPVLANAVGQALLDSKLRAGDALLVSWGRATWSVSNVDLPAIPGVVVVPAVGGLNDEQPWVQTNEIARRLAARLEGSVLLLHAPAVPSDELRQSLLTDESIRAALMRWDDAAAALVGIGAWSQGQPEPPSILSMSRATLRASAGDVAARLFDADGNSIPYETERRLLGISREQLARVHWRIGVAVGTRKIDAIVGAARSRLVNVLVTDVITASALTAQGSSTPSASGRAAAPRRR